MAELIQSSVIIPVYNKWELTETCLRSLESVLAGRQCEVIVIDNASSDATAECCSGLGGRLFGRFFQYLRMEQNINFGPASNLGARMARGEHVLFLNNDTCAAPESPDWYDGLIRDFSDYANIAATGPVLLYPPGGAAPGNLVEGMRASAETRRSAGPLGPTVQHLGVSVHPCYKVGHLYEGIPASSPLAKKRRFFQVITAACMFMPRALFLEYGGFDEHYINGFEDVDLCARLWAGGWRMTVNPESRLYHFTSQTPGRHDHEEANSHYCLRTTMRHFVPDWHLHLAADGLELQVTEWLSIGAGMPKEDRKKLKPLLSCADIAELCAVVREYPFWYEGYLRLAKLLEEEKDFAGAYAVLQSLGHLQPSPEFLRFLMEFARRVDDNRTFSFALGTFCKYCSSFESYLNVAERFLSWAEELGIDTMIRQLRHWLETAERFREILFLPFLRELRQLTRATKLALSIDWSYAMWRELHGCPQKRAEEQRPSGSSDSIAFSVLIPVIDLAPERLRLTVNSLLAQKWAHWEACLAAAPVLDLEAGSLLQELGALDPRVRVTCLDDADDASTVANAALDMAENPYVAVMAQGDLLAPEALMDMASLVRGNPDGLFFHSDEDSFSEKGVFVRPYFKNSVWDWDLLLGQGTVSRLGIYRADRMREAGGFHPGLGKAWEYDMLLRYTEGMGAERIIHIPAVLYHAYAAPDAEGEAAEDISQLSGGSLLALSRHLERTGTAGAVEPTSKTGCQRVRYDMPKPSPLVSLVLDVGADVPLAPALAQAVLAKAGHGKLEVLLLHDREVEQAFLVKLERWASGNRQVRLLPVSQSLGFGERANAAARAAKGGLIGYLGKGAIPLTQDWLVELVSRLMLPRVGVVGGRLVSQAGAIHHIGHMPDERGRLFSLFRGLPASEAGHGGVRSYHNWAGLARTVSSTDPRCFFTHKRLIEECGGFDAAMGGAAVMDFCLRLKERGLRTVATPFAGFLLSLGDEAAWENGNKVAQPYFLNKWKGRISPCHPWLAEGEGDWTFVWDDEEEERGRAAHPAASVRPAQAGSEAVPIPSVVSGVFEESAMRHDNDLGMHNKAYYGKIDLNDPENCYTQSFFFLREHCRENGVTEPKVLEIGCNTGSFSQFMKDAGAFVYGVEPFSDEAMRQGYVDGFFHGMVESFLDSEERKELPLFDAVVFGDVLEHLMDPQRVLLRVADSLKPGGVIIASVPNVAHLSVRRMLEDGQWLYKRYGLLDSTHRYFFTRHSLRKFLIRVGFGIERSHHTLAPIIEEYAPGLLDGGADIELNERDHTYQIVVRASRPALADEAFTAAPPLKVLLMAKDVGSLEVLGRLVLPLLCYCRAVGGELRVVEDSPQESLLWADILVMHGLCSSRELSVLREACSLGISVVYDFSELLYESLTHLDPSLALVLGQIIRYASSTADRVTCATDALREELLKQVDNPFVVPDAVYERPSIEVEEMHREVGNCAFVLVSDPQPPAEPLLEALRRFFNEQPRHALIGIGPVASALAEAGLPVIAHDPSEPDAFIRVLLSLRNAVGLIPLHASPASSCKSTVMFHRFTLCGLASIASEVMPYSEEIRNGETGLLTDNTADGWLEAMKLLADNAGMRRVLLARALRHCRERSLPDKAVEAWRRAFHGLPRPDERLRSQVKKSAFPQKT